MNILQAFEEKTLKALPSFGKVPAFQPGDTLKVHVRITEGAKERIQIFEGVCIGRRNRGLHSSFRVRRLLAGEWFERLFPLHSPLIKIERVRQGSVRRAKLYYLRGREGKAARIKEKRQFTSPGSAKKKLLSGSANKAPTTKTGTAKTPTAQETTTEASQPPSA